MQIYPNIKVRLDGHGWPNIWKTLKLNVAEIRGHLFTTMCYNTICLNQTLTLNPFVFLMQKFWFVIFSPPQGDYVAPLSFKLFNQLSKLHDVPSFLNFMKIWTFQGLWDLNEIQVLCLFTLVMFVSWFLGTTYFSCSFSSWFHDSQASCLFTLMMFIFWFIDITLFSCSFSC